ncbi:MAG: hypothetical protein WCH35_17525, partial [Comamonadaceae bacterium]
MKLNICSGSCGLSYLLQGHQRILFGLSQCWLKGAQLPFEKMDRKCYETIHIIGAVSANLKENSPHVTDTASL